MASTSTKTGALIFLHGLGDTPAGWSQLRHTLPQLQPRLAELEYVFPPAPTIPITINGGARMPGWFDIFDWPIAVGSKDDPKGLEAAVKQVETYVKKLNDQGIPNNKIIIGGFSQGGAIALLAAYRNTPAPAFAGCVGLSAWLTMPDQWKVDSDVAKSTPMYWGHGSYDDKVLFPQQKFGVDKLKSQGVTVTDQNFPIGHSSHPDEMEAFASFVDKQLFGDSKDGEL